MSTFKPKYSTREEIHSTVKMMVQPVAVEARFIYPIPFLPVENQSEFVVLCQCVYGEARGEKEEGWIEVAKVILNRWRVQKAYFGMTIREVVLKHSAEGVYQFSCMNPKDKNFRKLEKPEPILWYQIVRALLPIVETMEFSNEHACLYYRATDSPLTRFFSILTFVKTVGNHSFYTD